MSWRACSGWTIGDASSTSTRQWWFSVSNRARMNGNTKVRLVGTGTAGPLSQQRSEDGRARGMVGPYICRAG